MYREIYILQYIKSISRVEEKRKYREEGKTKYTYTHIYTPMYIPYIRNRYMMQCTYSGRLAQKSIIFSK